MQKSGRICVFVFAFAMSAPAWATVAWTTPGSADAAFAILANDGRRVCRGLHEGTTVAGYEEGGLCFTPGTAQPGKLSTYEVAYGFGSWSGSRPPNVGAALAGTNGPSQIEVCRVFTGRRWDAGTLNTGSNVCRYQNGSSSRYEVLYNGDPGAVHFVQGNTGSCMVQIQISLAKGYLNFPCDNNMAMMFRLESAGLNIWRLRNEQSGE